MDSDMSRRVVAEFFGTFWLVLRRLRRRRAGRGVSRISGSAFSASRSHSA